jgi:maltose O-acetyltransferase
MSLMKERMRAGELYRGDDPELNAELDGRQALVQELNAVPYADTAERTRRLTQLLDHLGEDAIVRSPFYCDWGDGIRIGERTFVNVNCTMLDGASIEIGRECLLASSVQLITATHPVDPGQRREAWELAAPITVGDGVWLGAGAIVCPGVSIGENSVIGAGAVVTRDVPAGVVAFGNPARVQREISAADRIQPPQL